jgi:DNA-binding HxlR family transcriptional regulator
MAGHQQFCPVALAAEVLARRWNPLIIRELLMGSTRFNEIHHGVSRMSRTLLSTRLVDLQEAGLLERRQVDGHPEYHLTPAGEALRPIIIEMGTWGKRWLKRQLTREHMDVVYLMWDMRRQVPRESLPAKQVVVHFHFTDAEEDRRDFWLILRKGSVDLCLNDPGYESDLCLTCEVKNLVDVWLGDADLGAALRDRRILLRGPRDLRRQFPRWLGLSLLAGIERKG